MAAVPSTCKARSGDMVFIPKRGICGYRLPLLWDFYLSHQIFLLNHTRAPVFCLNVAKLQQIQGAIECGRVACNCRGGRNDSPACSWFKGGRVLARAQLKGWQAQVAR